MSQMLEGLQTIMSQILVEEMSGFMNLGKNFYSEVMTMLRNFSFKSYGELYYVIDFG